MTLLVSGPPASIRSISYPLDSCGSVDVYEALVTAQEMERELRAGVRARLGCGRLVEIPGLGRSIRVYD